MRNFYFFRHGQTNANVAGIPGGGGISAVLTDVGINQAVHLAEILQDKNIDAIYSSPMPRAVHTAQIVSEHHGGVPIIIDDGLSDAAFGFCYSDNADMQQRIDDNFNRIRDALGRIIAQNEYMDVAVASHGGVTRALCWAAGMRVDTIKNCQCFHFVLDDNRWHFVESFDSDSDVVN